MILHYSAACSFTEIVFIIISACVCVYVWVYVCTHEHTHVVAHGHGHACGDQMTTFRSWIFPSAVGVITLGSSGLCNKYFHSLSHLPSNGDLVLVAISYYPTCLEVIRDFGNRAQTPELSLPGNSEICLCLWTIVTWMALLYICDDFLCQATLRGRLLSQTSAITLLCHPAPTSESMNFS